jgi:hypothetical protein
MTNAEFYWRWKNGESPDVLAKEAGVTRERMRHRLRKLDEDAGFLLVQALRGMVWVIEDFREAYEGVYSESTRGINSTPWEEMDEGGPLDAWLADHRAAKALLEKLGATEDMP